jgi:hypothetical protein
MAVSERKLAPVQPRRGWTLQGIALLLGLVIACLTAWFPLQVTIQGRLSKKRCQQFRQDLAGHITLWNSTQAQQIATFADADLGPEGSIQQNPVASLTVPRGLPHWALNQSPCYFLGAPVRQKGVAGDAFLRYQAGSDTFFLDCLVHGPVMAAPGDRRLRPPEGWTPGLVRILQRPTLVFGFLVFALLAAMSYRFVYRLLSLNWQFSSASWRFWLIFPVVLIAGLCLGIGLDILSPTAVLAMLVYFTMTVVLGLLLKIIVNKAG